MILKRHYCLLSRTYMERMRGSKNGWRVQAILSLFSIIELPNGALSCNLNFLCNFSRNFSYHAMAHKKRFYNDNKFEKRITIHFLLSPRSIASFFFHRCCCYIAKMELNRLCFVIVLLLSRQMTIFSSLALFVP